MQLKRASLSFILVLATACSGGGSDSSSSGSATGDKAYLMMKHWNHVAVDASGLDHTRPKPGEARTVFGEQAGPVRAARAMAIVHIGIADAVASITGKFESYLPTAPAPAGTDLQAAIAQAAHDGLVAMFPAQTAQFDQDLVEDLAGIPDGDAKTNGIAVGHTTAGAILTARENDGSEQSEPLATISYHFNSAPGHWQTDPTNPGQKQPLGSKWSLVKPFVMKSADEFRLPPPPPLGSSEYAAAYNEVKRLGGDGVTTPTERTPEQTEIGIFWAYDGTPSLCAPPRLYNQMIVQLAEAHGADVVELARLLAIENVAMADAGIASWESKFFYDFWRPVTGIREGDLDGNGSTPADATFTPLGAPASNTAARNFTPPFPSYPSGHATFGGAMFQILRRYFGTDHVKFTFVSDEFNGHTADVTGVVRPNLPRTFDTFSQAEEENGQSRIYLGIHWSFDKTGGIAQGNKVGDLVYDSIYKRTN